MSIKKLYVFRLLCDLFFYTKNNNFDKVIFFSLINLRNLFSLFRLKN
jgi:hypothetical protein